jgi:hypothetical protein
MTAQSAQTDYPFRMSKGFVGDRADHGSKAGHMARPYTNPALPEIYTVTIGGTTADGEYKVNITFNTGDVNGAEVRQIGPVEHVFDRQSAETDTQIAAALVAQLNLISGTRLFASNAGAVITIKFKSANLTNTVATVAPGGATAVVAQTQTAGGSNLRVGVLVARIAPSGDASEDNILTPIVKTGTPTDVGDIVGIAERTHKQYQDATTDTVGYDIYRIGQSVSVGTDGRWYMVPYTDVKPSDAAVVWINEAGPNQVGQVGTASPDGDQLDISSKVEFVTTALAGELTEVRLKF